MAFLRFVASRPVWWFLPFLLMACTDTVIPPAGLSPTPTTSSNPSPATQVPVVDNAATAPVTATETNQVESNTQPTATNPPTPISEDTATVPPTRPAATNTAIPCRITGRVLDDVFPSTIAFGDYRYRIYLPPCYGRDQRVYPTLYLFGGNTHDEGYYDEAGLDELAEEAIMAGDLPPMLIVMPDGGWVANTTSGGPTSYEGLIMTDLLPFIEENYCAWPDPAGRAIGGLSRGGYWSLEIAFRHPDQFASVGGHSAALIDSFAGPEVNPQFTGLDNDLGDLRIYLDIGENDWLLPNKLRLHEEMTAFGVSHEWHLNEGAHEDSYWPAHFMEYLEWYAAPWSFERSSYPLCER